MKNWKPKKKLHDRASGAPNHSFPTIKIKKIGPLPPASSAPFGTYEARRRDCFGVRFYLNTNEFIYTRRVKNVQNYHLLHMILQRHHFVEAHTSLHDGTTSVTVSSTSSDSDINVVSMYYWPTPASLSTVGNLDLFFSSPSSFLLLCFSFFLDEGAGVFRREKCYVTDAKVMTFAASKCVHNLPQTSILFSKTGLY